MSQKGMQRSNSSFSDFDFDFSDSDSDEDNNSLIAQLSSQRLGSIARFASESSSSSLPDNDNVFRLIHAARLQSAVNTIDSLGDFDLVTSADLARFIALQSSLSASTFAESVITATTTAGVPTVGLFNILPPQLLRRSKGEVKITNTNLQKDSSNEPVEVLLSTITPIYNKKQSNIFPELFTVIDKIYDKVDHSTDLNNLNDKILELIKKVKDETTGLEGKYIKRVEP